MGFDKETPAAATGSSFGAQADLAMFSPKTAQPVGQRQPQRFPQHKLNTSNLSFIPPTPMSAYFDAEDASVEYEENSLSTSSSPPTSSGTNGGVKNDLIESSSPITPATPGTWKPRELTLLRSRAGTAEVDSKDMDRQPDIPSALDGLGIRGLPTGPTTQQNVRTAALRDVLPIVSATSHARTMSNSTHSSQASVGPRELRLAGSLAAGANHRFGAMRNASSSPVEGTSLTPPMPAFRSRSPTLGSSPLGLSTTSRLPVRRGPAFDTPPALDSAKSAHGTFAVQKTSDSESGARNGGRRADGDDATRGGEGAAAASRLSTSAASPLLEDFGSTAEAAKQGTGSNEEGNDEASETLRISPLQNSPEGLQERKGSITSMQNSIIETCANGSRKKGPPAPLVLLPSPSSTYSKNSLETSLPNSALSLPPTTSAGYEFGRASVSQPAQRAQPDDLNFESFLAPGTALSTVAPTPFTGSHDAFLTPLQSPAAAVGAGRAPIDREAITAGDLLNRLGTLDLESNGAEDVTKQEEAKSTVTEKKPDAWHRQTLSSASSGNAFEYDSLTDGKRATIADKSTDSHEESSRHTSSLSSQSRRAPSPSPNLVFNTRIFSSPSPRPRSTTEDPSPSYEGPIASRKSTSSALNKSQSVEGQLSSGANDSLQTPHRTADISWNYSASPLSASTSHSTDVTSVASRSQHSEHFEPGLAYGASNAGSRRSTTTGKRSSTDAAKRRSSQLRSAKPCAEVPDVPSFGYMGTAPQPSFLPGSQQVSPTTTILPPQALYDAGNQQSVHGSNVRAEIQGSSHWSSGSEDEDDQRSGSLKSTRKNGSRSRKGSQSAASFSGSTSRRSTGVSSQHSLAPLKKANLFAGLGLRKKSAPTLLSDASSSASSPMPLPSDSPIVGRSDGMREFPFPQQQSKLSLSVASLRSGTSSAAVSAAPSPISSPLMRLDHSLKDTSGESTIRGATRFLQRQASTPSLAERFTATFNGPLRSKAAAAANNSPTEIKLIGSPITSTASVATSGRTPGLMTPSNDSAAPSPLSERGCDQDQQYSHGKAAALQGLGIQVGQDRNLSAGNALESAAEKTSTPPDDFRRHTRNVSVKSYQSSEAYAKVHDGHSSYLDDGTNPGQVKRSSVRNSGHRQRSMTINSSERASMEARDAAMKFYNGHRFPGTTFGFGDESAPPVPRLRRESVSARGGVTKSISTATSPNDTPQIPLIPLGSAALIQPTGQDDDGYDGLYAMGKALAQNFATPPPSSPSTHEHVRPASEKTKRRVRRTVPCARPHYNSLTEYGRAWQAAHADESYFGALGPALLELALSDSCCEGRIVKRNTVSSGTASSATDDYSGVSAEGGAARMGKPAGSGARGQGGDDDRSDDYEDGKRYIANEKDAYMTADDSESDGEYGGQENDLPEFKPSVCKEGSDEAPIGVSLRDPVQIMHKLQRSGTMPARAHRSRRAVAEAEAACGSHQGISIDVAELASRLHSLQRSSTHHYGDRAAPSSADQYAFPSSSAQGTDGNGDLSLYDKLNKPLPEPKEATPPSSTARSDQQSIISDFAQRVRKRSQSRSRMRPVAMDHSSSAPVPTVPVCNTLAQAIARSQSQPRSKGTEPDSSPRMLANAVPLSSTVDSAMNSLPSNEARSSPIVGPARLPLHRGRPPQCADELVEHRIYLAGMQRFQMAVVKRSACSRDLINSLAETNSLPSDQNPGDWAIFDVRSDMGMERPLREYESIADVLSARHAVNARRGALLIKRSDLAPYLSVQAVPKAAPALAGWMYVLDGGRKASWVKRWCELRDGILYSAKSERGRDEVQICDLKAFDVYTPLDGETTWASRAPKKNSFALCNVSSSPAVHDVNAYHFCMSDARAARHWITAISRARTFVMRNEAPGLFVVRTSSRNNASSAPSSSDAAPGPASGTAMTRSPAPAPLVQLSTLPFEKGSLLAAAAHGRTAALPQSQPLGRLHTNTGHRKPVPE